MRLFYVWFALLIGFASSQALAQNLPGFPFITVTGHAKVEVPPDMATVNFQVIAFNKKADIAVNTVAKRGEQILQLAKKYGLKSDDIESYAVDKQVRRQRKNGDGNLDILGYQITQRFTLTLHGLEDYEKLFNAIIKMQNTGNINTSFDVSNREQVIKKLVAKAGADAKAKARRLADGLSAKIRSVYAITDGGGFNQLATRFGISNERYAKVAMADSRQRSFDLYAPQTITLSKQVKVIFRMRP